MSAARKFAMSQRLVHVATGSVYRVVHVPPRLNLKIDGIVAEPGYALTLAQGEDVTLWVMPQSQVEDGRFQPEARGQCA